MGAEEPNATYSYATVERALARVFAVNEASRPGWFRARLQNFRRLGLTPSRPGRGKVVAYTLQDIDEWVLAFELIHFRVDPTLTVELVKKYRQKFREFAADARNSTLRTEVFVTLYIEGLSGLPRIGRSTKDLNALGNWLSDGEDRRISLFNLSVRLQSLDRALAEATRT